MPWDTVVADLQRWHRAHDPEVGRVVFAFLEVELRGMVPAMVRRTWSADRVEDALRDFLAMLIEAPLPDSIRDPRAYLARSFKNHCIDLHEAYRRRQETSVETRPAGWAPPMETDTTPAEEVQAAERARRLRAALGQLDVADRVALKLEHAPGLLDDKDLRWMGDRLGMKAEAVRQAVAAAADTHTLTRLFDPGDDDPDDPVTRRKRMERFRRRRARACEKLWVLMEGDE